MKLIVLIGLAGACWSGSALAQTSMTKAATSAGSSTLTGTTVHGHLSVGLTIAGRVDGGSELGWLGFYPVKQAKTVSVSERTDRYGPIYPNPAAFVVAFPLAAKALSTTVLNDSGERIDHLEWSMEAEEGSVNVRSLPAGTYSLHVQYADHVESFRFAVVR